MGLQECYEIRKEALLKDPSISQENRGLFKVFFEYEERKLKRHNNKKLTVKIVAEAIKKATSDPRILQSAKKIKASLAEENGVARAVKGLHEALRI